MVINTDPAVGPFLVEVLKTLDYMGYVGVGRTVRRRLIEACEGGRVFEYDRSDPDRVAIRLRPEILFALMEVKTAALRRELGSAAQLARCHELLAAAGLWTEWGRSTG